MLNEILKQNGAYASVENNVGSGTTVKIFLPRRLMRKLASFPLLQAPNSRGDGGGALFVFSALRISIPQIACCGWCARAVHTPATERK